jgi:hypothetical protein
MMTFRVVHKPSDNHVRCPYRIVEQVYLIPAISGQTRP